MGAGESFTVPSDISRRRLVTSPASVRPSVSILAPGILPQSRPRPQASQPSLSATSDSLKPSPPTSGSQTHTQPGPQTPLALKSFLGTLPY